MHISGLNEARNIPTSVLPTSFLHFTALLSMYINSPHCSFPPQSFISTTTSLTFLSQLQCSCTKETMESEPQNTAIQFQSLEWYFIKLADMVDLPTKERSTAMDNFLWSLKPMGYLKGRSTIHTRLLKLLIGFGFADSIRPGLKVKKDSEASLTEDEWVLVRSTLLKFMQSQGYAFELIRTLITTPVIKWEPYSSKVVTAYIEGVKLAKEDEKQPPAAPVSCSDTTRVPFDILGCLYRSNTLEEEVTSKTKRKREGDDESAGKKDAEEEEKQFLHSKDWEEIRGLEEQVKTWMKAYEDWLATGAAGAKPNKSEIMTSAMKLYQMVIYDVTSANLTERVKEDKG